MRQRESTLFLTCFAAYSATATVIFDRIANELSKFCEINFIGSFKFYLLNHWLPYVL